MLDEYLNRTVQDANGCLIWQGSFNSDGYPRAGTTGNTNIKVHREIFYLVSGYYPDVVRHTCDNITCINPDHLIGGTNLDNINDRHQRNRTHNQVMSLEIDWVSRLRYKGLTYTEIAKELDIHPKRVEYIMNKYVKNLVCEGELPFVA